jgi:phenylpyruvate tautomerase PptA (4-oxalocrotonate tautomerase family)
MPTYHCTAPAGLLDQQKKSDIAKEITRVHNAVTGAAAYFAQVIFHDVSNGNHFMGGAPLQSDLVFVHGIIRAGRSVPDRQKLTSEIMASVGRLSGLHKRFVWVYITENPARQMAEYGHILPEPGDEPTWFAGLPEEDRAYMQSVGK